jgi:uncharacterized protein YqgC (DUF456 family)
MTYLYAGLLVFLNTLGLILVVVGLPGTWFMVLATSLVAWLRWNDHMFSPYTLIALAALALVGEVLELVAGAVGSRKAGGTWRGSTGALVFGVVGGIAGTFLIPIPVVGSILGACLGAFGGAMLGEMAGGRPLSPAVEVGRGAFVGRLLGSLYKLAIGMVIWTVALVASLV